MNKYLPYRQLLSLILSLLLIILSGCQTESTVPDSQATLTSANEATVLPSINESPLSSVINSVVESPVPTPVPKATALPNPQAGTGSVSGSLIWVLKGNNIPADTAHLYLGPVVENEAGVPHLASLDKEHDPMAIADPLGRFAFLNVKPGTYTLIYSLPGFTDALINERGNEDNFFIVVKANEITVLDQITSDYPLY